MADDLVEEYVCKFLDEAPYEWKKMSDHKIATIQDVGIAWRPEESRVTFQGNPLKTRTTMQILQCRKEAEAEKEVKLQIHRRLKDTATQTETDLGLAEIQTSDN